MKYRFYGDKFELIKYEIKVEHEQNDISEEYTEIINSVTDEERDRLLERYPDAVVTEVDNTGYEYLDGETFTQEQLRNGGLEAAIAMGAEAYEAMKNAPTQDEINAMLAEENAQLKEQVASLETELTDTQLALCDVYELLDGGEANG